MELFRPENKLHWMFQSSDELREKASGAFYVINNLKF